jgi:hypothetical protein
MRLNRGRPLRYTVKRIRNYMQQIICHNSCLTPKYPGQGCTEGTFEVPQDSTSRTSLKGDVLFSRIFGAKVLSFVCIFKKYRKIKKPLSCFRREAIPKTDFKVCKPVSETLFEGFRPTSQSE